MDLRRILDPANPGKNSTVIRTERGAVTAYRLDLGAADVDVFQFEELVGGARQSSPTEAAELLIKALDLWRGEPFFDVKSYPFAAGPISRLVALQQAAKRDLMHAYIAIGLPDKAELIARMLAVDLPDDAELAGSLRALRERLHARNNGEVYRYEFTDPAMSLVVTSGDLFAHDDAHLVVGFTDTFDTAADGIVISTRSVQAQLLSHLYGNNRVRLQRQLRSALRDVTPIGTEAAAAKPRGKRTRYPIGTVAMLRSEGRCVFAVAYSRMGNNLIARSSLDDLRLSLDKLWDAVYFYGQQAPLAMPLVGSGLARIQGARPRDLLVLIIESFVARSRTQFFCPELRIIVPPTALEKIGMLDVATFVRDELPRRIG
ncbi:hypothetical protein Acor_80870 [Acrocarpospora corrugata]|uniref:Bacterial transcriptional activator domain-containing protein n=2 Tax=Acrocarpospora corrugata TaxID=35763 RepID=A0A5M3WI37_9ACTN|nr:hypothetical protein Acor_80870 [Acrocarpospora corrugata]